MFHGQILLVFRKDMWKAFMYIKENIEGGLTFVDEGNRFNLIFRYGLYGIQSRRHCRCSLKIGDTRVETTMTNEIRTAQSQEK